MNEFEPSAEADKYADALDDLQHSNFFLAVSGLDEQLSRGASDDLVDRMIDAIREEYLHPYEFRDAWVSGDCYPVEESGALYPIPMQLDGTPLRFMGIRTAIINDTRRTVFDFCDDKTSSSYLALPESITKLVVDNNEQEAQIRTLFAHYAEITQQRINSPEFQTLTNKEQQLMLRQWCDEIRDAIDFSLESLDVDVDCNEYYSIQDDADTIDFEDMHVDHSYFADATRRTMHGKVMDVTFLEQIAQSSIDLYHTYGNELGVQSTAEMPRSGGVPCLVLRTRANNGIYFIQFDKINDVISDLTDE